MPPENTQTETSETAPKPEVKVAADIPPTKKTSLKLIIIIAAIAILIIIAVVSYLFLPKTFSQKYVGELKPEVANLKTSFKSVKNSMNQIHYMVTSETTQTPEGLKTSGVLIHPNISALRVESNILGVSTQKAYSPIETTVVGWSKFLQGTNQMARSQTQVLGTKTIADNTTVNRFQQVKEETMKTNQSLEQADKDFAGVSKSLHNSPPLLTSDLKKSLEGSTAIEKSLADYFSEARKMSNYYGSVSDILITMNTKIISFKNSLASTGDSFNSLYAAKTPADQRAVMDKAQIYLNQAKQDSDDIKRLAQTLSSIPQDKLPAESAQYQEHNIKVLNTVNTYFEVESKMMQTLIDQTNEFITQSESGQANSAYVNSFKAKTDAVTKEATLGDTKFVSDLTALIGEEGSLTTSFWLNNNILNQGDSAENNLNDLQRSLDSI